MTAPSSLLAHPSLKLLPNSKSASMLSRHGLAPDTSPSIQRNASSYPPSALVPLLSDSPSTTFPYQLSSKPPTLESNFKLHPHQHRGGSSQDTPPISATRPPRSLPSSATFAAVVLASLSEPSESSFKVGSWDSSPTQTPSSPTSLMIPALKLPTENAYGT